MGRICKAVVSVTLAATALAMAQERVFRVDVRLVRLLATVKDSHGRSVGDLKKEEFTVYENGVAQEIKLFERHSAQPLSVALLIDTSGSTAKDFQQEKESIARFLKALTREGNPDDGVSLFAFNWQVEQVVDFTRNAAAIERRLRNLKPEAGTSLYDAIYLAAEQIEEREGRHVMVVVTDGADTVSTRRFPDALEALHRTDSVLYSIVIMPITNDAGRALGGEHALQMLSAGTGGRVFLPTLGASMDQAFDDILRELRTQYLIGYYPQNVKPTKERFHTVQVKVDRPGLRVVTRTGYFADAVE